MTKSIKNTNPTLTLTRNQVSPEFHEKFIINGYRVPNSTFKTCLKSIFYLNNNETLNFWTHFIPFMYLLYKIILFVLNINFDTDYYQWPFFIYLLTCAFYMLMSSFAHALNCMSNIARHLCFILDYVSISLYGMGCCIAYKTYSLENMPSYTTHFFDYYVTLSMCVSLGCNVMTSASRFIISTKVRSTLRLTSFIGQYLFINIPLIYRVLIKSIPKANFYLNNLFNNASLSSDNQSFDDNLLDSDYYYWIQFILIILSATVYGSHVPERFAPGKFDIVGQSHQIFHILATLSNYAQMCALDYDLHHLKPSIHFLIENSTKQSFNVTFASTATVAAAAAIEANNTTNALKVNFYTYAIQNVDFLTVTFSPFFRTKFTYAFIMLVCIILNSFILIYYYFKALYYNPWHKFYTNTNSSCSFCDSIALNTIYDQNGDTNNNDNKKLNLNDDQESNTILNDEDKKKN